MNSKDILNNEIIKHIFSIIKGITSIQLLQLSYWFHNPGPVDFMARGVLIPLLLFALIIFIGIGMLLYNKFKIGRYPPKNIIFKDCGIGLLIIGISGEVFTLMRSQGINFLGVRFFLLANLLLALGFAAYYLRLYLKRLPAEILKYEANALKKKYLAKFRRR